MISIRDYTDDDAVDVGCLIAETYSEFNLSFASPYDRALMLGPFLYADSQKETHKKEIVNVLRSPSVLVAVKDDKIVGVLRGRKERLASLFVHRSYQYQGIGRKLVERFEIASLDQGVSVIRVASTLYAVNFYRKLGYQRSTGVRTGWSFSGHGLPFQPMKKLLTGD